MRKILGEYKEDLEKLFNSFRKRFGLEHKDTLAYVDELISDLDYAILYFASDRLKNDKDVVREATKNNIELIPLRIKFKKYEIQPSITHISCNKDKTKEALYLSNFKIPKGPFMILSFSAIYSLPLSSISKYVQES